MSIRQDTSSALSLSFPLTSNSILYTSLSVLIFSNDFTEMLPGKIQYSNKMLFIACPQIKLKKSLKIEKIYHQIRQADCFLLEQEASQKFSKDHNIEINSESLVYLSTGSLFVYFEFENWSQMEVWTNGILQSDFLAVLNEFDGEASDHQQKFWVFNLGYERISEERLKLDVTVINTHNEFNRVDLNINADGSDTENPIVDLSINHLDSIALQIIDGFRVNCLSQIFCVGMSRDILSPIMEKHLFLEKDARKTFLHCAGWFRGIEKKHKTDQIVQQIAALSEKNDSSLLKGFRLLQLQKLALQMCLKKLSEHSNLSEENEGSGRLSNEYRHESSEIVRRLKSRDESVKIRAGKDCACDCSIF